MSQLSLRLRVLLAFLVPVLCLIAIAAVSQFFIQNIHSKYSNITKTHFPSTVELLTMQSSAREIRTLFYRLALPSLSNEDIEDLASSFEDKAFQVERSSKELTYIGLNPEAQALHKKVIDSWETFSALSKKMLAILLTHTPESKVEFTELLNKEFRIAANEYFKSIGTMVDYQIADSRNWSQQAEVGYRKGNWATIGITLMGLVVALFTGYFFSRKLTEVLASLTHTLTDGFSTFVSASEQISNASTNISLGASKQASALQQTMTVLNQVTSTLQHNDEKFATSLELSASSQNTANQGRNSVKEMIDAIEDISRSSSKVVTEVTESNRNISEIVKVISEIDSKAKVIHDIVFQTKLLSFNASVEAARAGEAGKGFAVVAEEVGNLARMSGQAAQEISTLLTSSVEKVNSIVSSSTKSIDSIVSTSRGKVDTGVEKAKALSQVIDAMTANMDQVSKMFFEIGTANKEQAAGMKKIFQAVEDLNTIMEKNTDAAKVNDQASRNLSRESGSLDGAIQSLKKLVQGT